MCSKSYRNMPCGLFSPSKLFSAAMAQVCNGFPPPLTSTPSFQLLPLRNYFPRFIIYSLNFYE